MAPYFRFEIIHQSKKSRARVGVIHTPHGKIPTPQFVPVGTNATIKAVDARIVDSLEMDLIFCNTYHLMLQPGSEVIKEWGGLHSFMGRSKPIITDSGGFQVFSLMYGGVADELKSRGTKKQEGSVLKIEEEGVLFRSYRDGKKFWLTPETSIQAQKDLGADIIIPFDELPPFHMERENLKTALDRTHRWEIRSLAAHLQELKEQAMYAVVHGGMEPELREKSATTLREYPFDGFAIGGSLGKNRDDLAKVLDMTVPFLSEERPRHLLGIGDVPSILPMVQRGVDTFDSSYPTKIARHGILLDPVTGEGVKITKTSFGMVKERLFPGCSCPVCTHYSAGYLNHLFKAHELLGLQLASIHNLAAMQSLTKKLREAILKDEI